jgi:hypothetical protein
MGLYKYPKILPTIAALFSPPQTHGVINPNVTDIWIPKVHTIEQSIEKQDPVFIRTRDGIRQSSHAISSHLPPAPEFENRWRPTHYAMSPIQHATIDHEEKVRLSKRETWAERNRAYDAAQELYAVTRRDVRCEGRVESKMASGRKRAEADRLASQLGQRLSVARERVRRQKHRANCGLNSKGF